MRSDIVEKESSFKGGFGGIIINVVMCFAFTLLSLLIFAVIITYTDFPGKMVSPIVILLTVLSILLAGFLTAKRKNSKGWLIGAATGLVYMIILYIIGALIYNNVGFGANTLAMFALGVLSGSFGGILGINLK